MALCKNQCRTCPMLVTVRIDYDENVCGVNHLNGLIGRQVVLDLFKTITDDLCDDLDDMTVILHVSGADVTAHCPRKSSEAECSIELF